LIASKLMIVPQSEVVAVEVDGHVATVWLDRPDKLNAMAPSFWADFPAVVEALGEDEAVRVIVVAGRGRAFSVGLDLEAFAPTLAARRRPSRRPPPCPPGAGDEDAEGCHRPGRRSPAGDRRRPRLVHRRRGRPHHRL